jgi:AcrR family transcriptional regulator
MARRSDHSREELREMALSAAEQIVSEQGYEALSARKVASAIGYTVGTLYLVFENIDDLLLQVNARTLDRLHRRMSRVKSRTDDPAGYVVRLGESYLRFANDDPHRWTMVFEHRLSDGREVPDWYQQKVSRMFALIEQGLEPFRKGHSEADMTQAARAIWGGVHGICILAISDNLGIAGVDSVQRLTESLIRNYLQGFTGGESQA